ncbi:MAG TPA: hypothetical protein VI356_01180 [Myxococcales bacterium]
MRPGHRAFVESWLRRRSSVAPQVLAGEALQAVWGRARRSLSDLSLQALGRCALDAATREFPVLADARVGPRGFELNSVSQSNPDEFLAALGGVLVEFLGLVEALSGGILAPALEAELLGVGGSRRPANGVG